MFAIIWTEDLGDGILRIASIIDKLEKEKGDEARQTKEGLQVISQTLRQALNAAWSSNDILFGVECVSILLVRHCSRLSNPRDAGAARGASIALARGRKLQNAFDPILHALLSAMNSNVVGHRQKALRSVGSIVVVDPQILALVSI